MMGIMKIKYSIAVAGIVICLSFILTFNQGHPSDTCMFAVTADDLPPNIVFLLDNGAEMKHPVTPADYDPSIDYTPTVIGDQVDAVANPESGNGFFNDNGYGIHEHGNTYYLVPVGNDLELDTASKLEEDDGETSGVWTINDQRITLPTEASSEEVVDDGLYIIDKAGAFRYSKNYLNWLFFYTNATMRDIDLDGTDEPIYDGSPLPDKSRFYYAKKALLTVGKLTSNKAVFALYNFTSTSEGSSNVQPLGEVVATLGATPEDNVLDSNYVNNINNMGTVMYSPLAEGMANIGGYYNSNSSGEPDANNYCQKNFVVVVSPGMSSEDTSDNLSQTKPSVLDDDDGDGTDGEGLNDTPGQGTLTVDGVDYTIPTNINGSTYMDDVAAYFYANDMRVANDKTDAFQNVLTYTVGFMFNAASRVFLINTSNNGNGKTNLTSSAHPDYGKYHFDAESGEGLSQAILDAVNSIISRTSSFTAPVVPVTRTTSGDKIYMAFFKPLDENFWEGNVTKFGLNTDNEIVGSDDNPATWPNGSMREDAQPYWETIDWADLSKNNGILNSFRNIYTYLGTEADLTHSDNRFSTGNTNLTAAILGNPTDVTVNGSTVAGKDKVIQYIRGADVLDQDADLNVYENRSFITGDVLHSEPLVFTYQYADDSAKTMVFFGANDGMLHAVLDVTDLDVETDGDETNHGTEAWAFIPPDQLSRLKEILEGNTHQDYVDSSPKAYFKDVDENGLVDVADGDQVILVCGLRKGGSSYFALDITNPTAPQYLWRISSTHDVYSPVVVSQLGESWSEPQFGVVKTTNDDTTGTAVFFIGGGYSADHSAGKALIAVNVLTGAVVKTFTSNMDYAVTSTAKLVDADHNGFVDKVYVGDLGGQMWRFGQVTTDAESNPLSFPDVDENINNWSGQILFTAPNYTIGETTYRRKFFYPPSVTLEKGYDLVFMGTGDRENACDTDTAADRIYCLKDAHGASAFSETDLVDVTDPNAAAPDLTLADGDVDSNSSDDQGWYIRLVDNSGLTEVAEGEKVLAEGMVFYKTYYVTTFTPNDNACVPGGNAKIYAIDYETGAAVIQFTDIDDDGDLDLSRSNVLGGGIPSKPVIVITGEGQKMFISLGSTNPDAASQAMAAGIIEVDPLYPAHNFFYLWWRELLN
jgi:type IV pilus assembly protein PilY1